MKPGLAWPGLRHECELAGMLHRALLPLAAAVYEQRPCQLSRMAAKPPGE